MPGVHRGGVDRLASAEPAQADIRNLRIVVRTTGLLAVAGHSPSKYFSILRRISASGRRPRAAPRFSSRCSTFVVPGIATVTAGCETTYLRNSWAKLVTST